ncbi:MAG: hypothetical protein IJY01_03200 [Clostridia bacterium]|nr:hypothetical protein [Clostridia bacterium]
MYDKDLIERVCSLSFVSADEHIALEKKLRSDGYTLLSRSEEYYYSVTEE